MRRLLGILYEWRDYFSLLFAVTISLYLLFSKDVKQVQILRAKANTVFSVLYSPVVWVEGINELKTENEILQKRVVQLKLLNSLLLYNKFENDRLREMLEYERNTVLNLIPAKVVGMGVSSLITSILIDVGENFGIVPNMAVISMFGLVGKVITVSNNTSLVQIMSDYNFRVSVKLEESGTTGILRWKSGNIFEVWEISKSVGVKIGERIVTSGYSDIFPENLPVGEVTGIIDRREMLHKIVVAKALSKFTALQHVFVVSKGKNESS